MTANGALPADLCMSVEAATVEIRYRSIHVLQPIGKQKRYPALTLTVLHAWEPEEPTDRPRIDRKLIADLPVRSYEAAIEKLRWYALRWKIEVYPDSVRRRKTACQGERWRFFCRHDSCGFLDYV
jgi:hypothetical protein